MRIEENKVVRLDYKVYDNDTNELLEDTAQIAPFFYIHGIGSFLPKIEEALEGREKGYQTTVIIDVEDGYGEYDEELVEEMNRADFDAEFDDLYVGMEFLAEMDDETEQLYTVKDIEDDKVIVDGNHAFAGRVLRFEVTVADVREATDEELEDGEPRFPGFEE